MNKVAKENSQNQEVKLEDILKSIRRLIDDKKDVIITSESNRSEDLEVLELTNVVHPDRGKVIDNNYYQGLLSSKSKIDTVNAINEFSAKVNKEDYVNAESYEEVIEKVLISIMKPMMKEWLDNNLTKLVEKVVSEEIRRLIPKK